jgi:hypothetical protein
MTNRSKYLDFYSVYKDSDLLLYPISGIFTNAGLYPITFNSITESDELKTLFLYYGFEQRNAIISGDLFRFDRVRRAVDVIIENQWSTVSNQYGIINRHSTAQRKSRKFNYLHNVIKQASKVKNIYNGVPPITYIKNNRFDAFIPTSNLNIESEKLIYLNNKLIFGYDLTGDEKFSLLKHSEFLLETKHTILKNSLTLLELISHEIKLYDSLGKLHLVPNFGRAWSIYLANNLFVLGVIPKRNILTSTNLLVNYNKDTKNEIILSNTFQSIIIQEIYEFKYLLLDALKYMINQDGLPIKLNYSEDVGNNTIGKFLIEMDKLDTRTLHINKNLNSLSEINLDTSILNLNRLWNKNRLNLEFLFKLQTNYKTPYLLNNTNDSLLNWLQNINSENYNNYQRNLFFETIYKSAAQESNSGILLTSSSTNIHIANDFIADRNSKEINTDYSKVKLLDLGKKQLHTNTYNLLPVLQTKKADLTKAVDLAILRNNITFSDVHAIMSSKSNLNGIIDFNYDSAFSSILELELFNTKLGSGNSEIVDIFDSNFNVTSLYKDFLMTGIEEVIRNHHKEVALYGNLTMDFNRSELTTVLSMFGVVDTINQFITNSSLLSHSKSIIKESYKPDLNKLAERTNLELFKFQNIWTSKRINQIRFCRGFKSTFLVNNDSIIDTALVLHDRKLNDLTIDQTNKLSDPNKKCWITVSAIEFESLLDHEIKSENPIFFETVQRNGTTMSSNVFEKLHNRQLIIQSINYVIKKSGKESNLSSLYLYVKGKQDILIDLNYQLPLDFAYKVSTILNNAIIDDLDFKNTYLTSMEDIFSFQKLILSDIHYIETFEKSASYAIINNDITNMDIVKSLKEIFSEYNFIYQEMFKRWYFIPSDGPYDPVILPMDYPYARKPIRGVIDHIEDELKYPYTDRVTREKTTEHPIPNGSDHGKLEIEIDIHIIANVVDFCYELWYANCFLYERYTPSQSLKHFVNLIYDWLDKYIPDKEYKLPEYYPTTYESNDNPNIYREDYWRLYRWIRWYAEAIIQNIPDEDLNSLTGNLYVKQLINDLVKYFNDHHGVYGVPGTKIFDKVKGVRHKWLSKYINKLL